MNCEYKAKYYKLSHAQSVRDKASKRAGKPIYIYKCVHGSHYHLSSRRGQGDVG